MHALRQRVLTHLPLELGVLAGSVKGWPERAGNGGPGGGGGGVLLRIVHARRRMSLLRFVHARGAIPNKMDGTNTLSRNEEDVIRYQWNMHFEA
jgi:hypothetical protein